MVMKMVTMINMLIKIIMMVMKMVTMINMLRLL